MSHVVPARPEHAGVLAALHARGFLMPWQPPEFEILLRQPGVAGLIAEEAGMPVGFIVVRAVADEAEILTLVVVPESRRRGIAVRLLTEALAILSAGGTARWFLEVAADNAAARALYAGQGFAPCGRRPNYYGRTATEPPADAIVMMRLISTV